MVQKLIISRQDIRRVARSLVVEFGDAAEDQVALETARCRKTDASGTMQPWQEVRDAIVEMR